MQGQVRPVAVCVLSLCCVLHVCAVRLGTPLCCRVGLLLCVAPHCVQLFRKRAASSGATHSSETRACCCRRASAGELQGRWLWSGRLLVPLCWRGFRGRLPFVPCVVLRPVLPPLC